MLSCSSGDIPGPAGNHAPTARISIPPGPLLEGSQITLDASGSSDADGDTLTYLWNLGDGVTRTSALTTRTYDDDGLYKITLIVHDQHGARDTATTQVPIENAPPDLSAFVAPVGALLVGEPSVFRVTARDPGITDSLTIQIDWKDGNISTLRYDHPAQEISVAHTYSTPGTYALDVRVWDNDGGVTGVAGEPPITVVPAGTNRRPVARIAVPSGPILEGSEVTLDGSGSSDPDGDSLTYQWNVGDDFPRPFSRTVRRYGDNGSYDVTLIVSDPHGLNDMARAVVAVENVAPELREIEVPAGSVQIGKSFTIGVVTHDPGTNDSLTVQVDWKDGDTTTVHYDPSLFLHQTIAHTFATPGNYAVTVTVRDKDGGDSTRAVAQPIVAIGAHTNHPPVARIEGPTSGSEGTQLRFSADASTDPDGDSLTATWFSGDGRSQKTPYPNYFPRSNTQWWSYPDNGTYIVSVIVVDDSGAADTASMPVTLANVAPTVEWYSMPYREAMGMPGSIRVTVADSGTADLQDVAVDWGDGTGQTIVAADTSIYGAFEGRHLLGATIPHTYATTGTYTITVTAHDDDGGVSSPIVSQQPVLVFDAHVRQTIGGYEAIDIGTLPGGNAARPEDINDRGQIVGTSLTGTWADHAFLWDESGMHDLGTMGHEGSEAIRINEAGAIAGTVWTHTVGIPGHNEISANIGTIWQNGVPRALDSTQVILTAGAGQPYCATALFSLASPRVVRAMNSSGDVAWAAYSRWCTTGWLWGNGSWQRLPSLPIAMNDRGQVVGATERGESPWYYHAFLAEGGSSRELGVLAPWACKSNIDCSMAMATDINQSGQVVGTSTDGTGRYHFVLWQDGTIKDLGFGDWTYPQNVPHVVINDRGQIAGSAGGKAFFWNADSMIALPSGGGSIVVVGLNENGYVAGTIQTGAEQHAFVWSLAQGMVDLGMGPDGFSAAWVVDINARGDIVGYTAPCKPAGGNRCADSTRNPGSLGGTQVRATLWRKR
jgi:probable HAF family extracellular repeat protein